VKVHGSVKPARHRRRASASRSAHSASTEGAATPACIYEEPTCRYWSTSTSRGTNGRCHSVKVHRACIACAGARRARAEPHKPREPPVRAGRPGRTTDKPCLDRIGAQRIESDTSAGSCFLSPVPVANSISRRRLDSRSRCTKGLHHGLAYASIVTISREFSPATGQPHHHCRDTHSRVSPPRTGLHMSYVAGGGQSPHAQQTDRRV